MARTRDPKTATKTATKPAKAATKVEAAPAVVDSAKAVTKAKSVAKPAAEKKAAVAAKPASDSPYQLDAAQVKSRIIGVISRILTAGADPESLARAHQASCC